MVQNLSVVGAGFMGHGIAQVALTAGVRVRLYDVGEPQLAQAIERMAWSLDKLFEKGKISEPADVVLARLHTTTTLQDLADADLIIEAVPEVESIKLPLHEKLDSLCGSNTILASNTSCIPISRLASATRRPDRFCGLHFFSPVPLMALVEVIRGNMTSDVTMDRAVAFVRQLGKEPVWLEKDSPGFIVNRILLPGALEAVRLVEAGVTDPTSIDKAMKLGSGAKMGPMETIDMTGVDVMLNAAQVLYRHTENPAFKPPRLLEQMVADGRLGAKTGQGFYQHPRPVSG